MSTEVTLTLPPSSLEPFLDHGFRQSTFQPGSRLRVPIGGAVARRSDLSFPLPFRAAVQPEVSKIGNCGQISVGGCKSF